MEQSGGRTRSSKLERSSGSKSKKKIAQPPQLPTPTKKPPKKKTPANSKKTDKNVVSAVRDTRNVEQEGGDQLWVQCDKCGEWYHITIEAERRLNSEWFCTTCETLTNRGKRKRESVDAATDERSNGIGIRPFHSLLYSTSNISQEAQLRAFVGKCVQQQRFADRSEKVEHDKAATIRTNSGTTIAASREKRSKSAAKQTAPRYIGPTSLQWVRCNNCGKWRALLSTTVARLRADQPWYCLMNTYDDSQASCSAPQETKLTAQYLLSEPKVRKPARQKKD